MLEIIRQFQDFQTERDPIVHIYLYFIFYFPQVFRCLRAESNRLLNHKICKCNLSSEKKIKSE